MLHHLLTLTHNLRMQPHPFPHIINNFLMHPPPNHPPSFIACTFSHKKLARRANTLLALIHPILKRTELKEKTLPSRTNVRISILIIDELVSGELRRY
jgi:hypothetical protein